MGGLSIWHILILGAIVVIFFGGRGKISDFMGDFAKGIRSFREGLKDPDDTKTINGQATPSNGAATKDKTTVG